MNYPYSRPHPSSNYSAIAKFSMKFAQTLDILLLKKSISNVQFWYFFKKFLYKLET